MYYRSLLTPQASFATGVPLVRMNACVVLEIVAAWLFDHAVHKELGQLWPVTPQLAWLSALIRECRKDFREALRKMWRACGHRVFGPQCDLYYQVYRGEPRGNPWSGPCPVIWQAMGALPSPIHQLLFEDQTLATTWHVEEREYRTGRRVTIFEALVESKGFHRAIFQILTITNRRGGATSDEEDGGDDEVFSIQDSEEYEEVEVEEEEEWEEVAVDNLAAYEAAFPNDEDVE